MAPAEDPETLADNEDLRLVDQLLGYRAATELEPLDMPRVVAARIQVRLAEESLRRARGGIGPSDHLPPPPSTGQEEQT